MGDLFKSLMLYLVHLPGDETSISCTAESLLLGPRLMLIRYGNVMKLQRFKLGFPACFLSLPIRATAKEKRIDVFYLAADLRVHLFGCTLGKTAN